MFERSRFNKIDDYFLEYAKRPKKGIYIGRLLKYSKESENFLANYLEDVKKCGVYIKGKMPNPDVKQLAYYEEIMGLEFKLDRNFLAKSLRKWLPRLDTLQNNHVVDAMYDTLDEMSRLGKTEMMVKNAYIKFMCWFYYKFERILNQLGREKLPKILYEGYVSTYELNILLILGKTGCDVLLLQYRGDEEYLKVDSKSQYSQIAEVEGGAFPDGYSIQQLQTRIQEEKSVPKIEFQRPGVIINTNTWLTGDVFQDALKPQNNRGTDSRFLYNLFANIWGIEDPAVYENNLLKWKMKLESDGRNILVEEHKIPIPNGEEVKQIPRRNYKNNEQMILDMLNCISFTKNREIEHYAKSGFYELMREEKDVQMQKLSNRGICLLCWMNRYLPLLFTNGDLKKIPVFIYYGICNNVNEGYLMRLLSRMPIDVIVICPDLGLSGNLEDRLLYIKKYGDSKELGKFPTQLENLKFGTVAYQAEQELNNILYQDTGVYRNRQFKKAIPISLHTTYEEIKILWCQEAKYRPNFETLDDRVMLPVIFSKVSGVPAGVDAYWNDISALIVEETYLVKQLPHLRGTDPNAVKPNASQFLKNGKLQIQKIKNHPSYQYAFIRDDMQDYLMDKLQQLIDLKIIKGTGTNGTEYTIVSTALNLSTQIMRYIQKFDFTKSIPKLILLNTNENICSIEDSIMVAYLNMLGFDIVIFAPTGYQSVERFFEQPLFVEHQVGEYVYDLSVPDFQALKQQKESFASKLFRRGR